jgi:putative ABC transport system permease protein
MGTRLHARRLFDEVRQRLAGNPFVESVATSETHGGMGGGGAITIGGLPRTVRTFVPFRQVDDNYFTTMRMKIRNGRQFLPSDVGGAPVVGIVSDSFARLIAPGGDVLGQHIEIALGAPLDIIIVGVVGDLFTDIGDAQPLAVYMPMTQPAIPIVNRALVFRATNDVSAAKREVLDVIRQLDPNVQLSPGLTLNERLMRQMAPQQFGLLVLGSLGTIALLLTILGTYVLAETAAVIRTRELGIRAVLGATTTSLTMLVVRESASLTAFGLCGGLLISWMGASTIRAFLLHIQPLDPSTLSAVAVLILLVSVSVSMRPALHAARIDLSQVLRSE